MRKTLAVSLCFILLLILTVTARAHSGRTDGNGGHTDHSTGEYHYHHGYSAHEHYDMDGDGDIDCPYEFDDKTDHSGESGNNSQSTFTPSYTIDIHPRPTIEFVDIKPIEREPIERPDTNSNSVFGDLAAICCGVIALVNCFIFLLKRRDERFMEKYTTIMGIILLVVVFVVTPISCTISE